MEWPGSLDEYHKLVSRMNTTPRVVIDNNACPNATVVKVDSARKHGVLLEAVQALSDLNLSITKAYISSDGRWFMDVFHVTDHLGGKLEDNQLLSLVQHSLTAAAADSIPCSSPPLTAIELTADDRPGLLSELFAVLGDLHCSISAVKLWTLNSRMASLLFLHDIDSINVNLIENRLRHVLNGDSAVVRPSTTTLSHADRRLHQLIPYNGSIPTTPPSISIQNLVKRDYSVINIHCHDRPKLLFDVVCTLTDMDYIVFHGTVHTDPHHNQAHQEFYVRHSDGTAIRSEEEKQKVVQWLQAAIERRSEKGVRLELCAEDRGGLLADVTRVLREHGLAITNAEVGMEEDGMVRGVFYVSDVGGCRVDEKAIDAVKERIGSGSTLKVGEEVRAAPLMVRKEEVESGVGVGVGGLVYLGSLVRRNLYNLGLIRSCS
ncbi:hypothetical protein J5N97_029285 [Dioscorea zingiberensis]|uniref:ACT domain-containing protein ACR n=1 Tax=Dioscorea zingiberensis TaxID=325984 RepID=A0A9D5C122_9LILI|nr:hypothetical protein J5N97_029285 [Dioscorea zingiberensis]